MKQGKNKGGRPRGFDRDEAIEAAMRLFWRHGYEGVSLAMLTGSIGVAAPSLYAAFGSKAGLYIETVERYAAMGKLFPLRNEDESASFDEALSRFFYRAIRMVSGGQGERGCMISTALMGCHPDHHDLAVKLTEHRKTVFTNLRHDLLYWLEPPDADHAARFLCTVLQGLAVQARDGATCADLRALADTACACIARMARH